MLDAKKIFEEYQKRINFKNTHNLYKIIERNEYFVSGEQWKNVNSKNLPKTTYNFLRQVAGNQISSVMSQQVAFKRTLDELSMEDEVLSKAVKSINKLDSLNWERLKMDTLNEEMLKDAYLSGLGIIYFSWDNSLVTGNKFVVKGDIVGELIDSTDFYVSNPSDIRIQTQDDIIISKKISRKKVIEMAKINKIKQEDLEKILNNDNENQITFSKDSSNEEDSKLITLLIRLWKENGTVFYSLSTEDVVIIKPTDLRLKNYPIAIMNWHKRKKFIYGTSPLTEIISNQIVANQTSAMRHLHAKLMSIPKVGYNKSMVSGFSNAIGSVMQLNVPPNANISNAIHYFQPAPISFDFDKSINQSIDMTKTMMGANQNTLGESNPENFKAIVAQQKASGIPLETIKRQFYQYLEDVANIWLDFYKNYYNITRQILIENDKGMKEIVSFNGEQIKDLFLNTKVEVGASTHWSELLQIETLNAMWEMGIIKNPVQYLERLPNNLIPNKDKLIDDLKSEDEKQQVFYMLLEEYLMSQPDFIKNQILNLPSDQQEQAIIDLILEQSGQQPMKKEELQNNAQI